LQSGGYGYKIAAEIINYLMRPDTSKHPCAGGGSGRDRVGRQQSDCAGQLQRDLSVNFMHEKWQYCEGA